MMKTKAMRAILVLSVMLLFLVGQGSAGYKDCYDCCYHYCRSQDHEKIYCVYHCGAECLTLPSPVCPPVPPEVESCCCLECAKSSCGHFDPGETSPKKRSPKENFPFSPILTDASFDALLDTGKGYGGL